MIYSSVLSSRLTGRDSRLHQTVDSPPMTQRAREMGSNLKLLFDSAAPNLFLHHGLV